MREKILDIIEADDGDSRLSKIYDILMIIVIIGSIIPLAFKEQYPIFKIIELISAIVFILDYLLRWALADIKMGRGIKSFFIYPFSVAAIVDLLSILPAIGLCNSTFKLFRVIRLIKVLRLFKLFRYSKQIAMLWRVLNKEKHVLLSVFVVAAFYIFITALIMFNAETNMGQEVNSTTNFNTFFDALYWATTTLTTVGYGDIAPSTSIGRFISMLSSIFGVAIIALPSGVITASYLEELKNNKDKGMDA